VYLLCLGSAQLHGAEVLRAGGDPAAVTAATAKGKDVSLDHRFLLLCTTENQ